MRQFLLPCFLKIFKGVLHLEYIFLRARFFVFFSIATSRSAAVSKLLDVVALAFREYTDDALSFELSIANRAGYRIWPDGRRSAICWDAPIAIMVSVNNKPAFGMAVELCGKTLSIRQLQGVKGTRIPYALREWPKIFIEGCVSYARYSGLKRVRVYRADQSPHYMTPAFQQTLDGKLAEMFLDNHQNGMRRRYDGTAKALGFLPKRRYYEWKAPKREWY